MNQQADFSAFRSRLRVRGHLTFQSALRVGAARGGDLFSAADLPVMKLEDGTPYIPGSSFKGGWRATTEALLRGLPGAEDHNLACISVPRDETTPKPDVCLTTALVTRLKADAEHPERWSDIVGPKRAPEIAGCTDLDVALRNLSCWTCRLFGAPWLAGKIRVKDLYLPPGWAPLVEPNVRDGVAMDRDTGTAADKQKYTYEVVPQQTPFSVQILIQNATEAELGLAWLGLAAFEQGQIPLGGARSRGLGACALEIDWTDTHWIDNERALLQALFPVETEAEAELPTALGAQGTVRVAQWRSTFLQTIGVEV